MSVPVTLDEVENRFLADFEGIRATLPGAGLAWLDALRASGIAGFKARGLPHRRIEEWKYTDLRGHLSHPLGLTSADAGAIVDGFLKEDPFDSLAGFRLVFADGHFRQDLSALDGLPDGVTITSLRTALGNGASWLEGEINGLSGPTAHPVYGLNVALAQDGAAIHVPADTVLEAPIRIVSISSENAGATAYHLRHVIVLGAGAKAQLLESHLGADTTQRLATGVSDIKLGERADLIHVKLQNDAANAVHLGGSFVRVGEQARYEGFAVTTGGAVTRNEAHIRFDGAHAFARVSGAAMLVDQQHCDNTTVIDHALPDCESHETFKNVLANRSRGVFQGKIIVRQDAQRTDGYQLSQALLLHTGAEADTKPELEIFADDVKCSHGATVGELDEDAIFYLRSRGIGEGQAKALLIRAFVGEVIEEIPVETIRDCLGVHIDRWLIAHRDAVEAAETGLVGDNGSEAHAA